MLKEVVPQQLVEACFRLVSPPKVNSLYFEFADTEQFSVQSPPPGEEKNIFIEVGLNPGSLALPATASYHSTKAHQDGIEALCDKKQELKYPIEFMKYPVDQSPLRFQRCTFQVNWSVGGLLGDNKLGRLF